MQPTKDSIKAWLKANSHSRDWLGEQLNVGKRTVDAWLSTSANIPAAKLAFIERLMQDDETSETLDIPTQSTIVLNPSQESLDAWSQAFKSSNAATLSEWAVESLNAFAANQSAFTEIIHSIEQDAIAAGFLPDEPEILRYEVPLLRAAAGSPTLTDAEVTPHPHPLGTGRYLLELVGDSMQPTFQHKQRIIIRSKDSLKRPLLKKGELYHFIIDGKTLFKRYNTRRATPQEIASGTSYTALDGTQKVKILESLNPTHPAITLTEPIEWLGWYDAQDNQLNGVVHP